MEKRINLRMKIAIAAVIVIVAIIFLIIGREKLTKANSVEIFFVKTVAESEYKVLPVRRKIEKDTNRFNFALTALINGPTKKEKKLGYFSEIPVGTKILNISDDEEKKIINLSEEFKTGGGSSSMEMRLEQLINTALSSAEDEPVYLEVEGEQINTVGGEGITVPQPLSEIHVKKTDAPCK